MSNEATQHIAKHNVDDTFYILDLGNVLRMLKVAI